MKPLPAIALLHLLALLAGPTPAQEQPTAAAGETAFLKNCAACHVGKMPGNEHAPRLAQLKEFPAQRIREALVNGRMRPNTRFMSKAEIEAVIFFLAAPPPAPEAPAPAASS